MALIDKAEIVIEAAINKWRVSAPKNNIDVMAAINQQASA